MVNYKNNSNKIDNTNSINQYIKVSKVLKDLELNKQILASFIFISIIAYFLFIAIDLYDYEYGLHGPASVILWTYGIILSSIFIMLLIDIMKDQDLNAVQSIPMVVIINSIYIFWIFSINLKFFKKINMRKVPPYYFYYSNCTSVILFIQFIFYLFKSYNRDETNILNNSKISIFNYFLIVINFFLIIIQQTILEKFSVDIL
tara:strand:- start:1120 stop:1725 length:606 start_codon:yes stop_codon:yes gene_type:complete